MKEETRKFICMNKNEMNPLCPFCKRIAKYSFDHSVKEFCGNCGYDLKRPVSKWQEFWHEMFWGYDKIQYCLARYYPEMELSESSFIKMMEGANQ